MLLQVEINNILKTTLLYYVTCYACNITRKCVVPYSLFATILLSRFPNGYAA